MSCGSRIPEPLAIIARMATEIELKLALSPAAAARFVRLPRIKRWATAKPRRDRLVSRYYDTPGLQLRAQQVALRVRQAGRHWVQALKGAGQAQGGLHTRAEWETPVAGFAPEFDRLPQPALAILNRIEGAARDIRPIFTTDFTRTTWQLEIDGALIEAALDQGEIYAGRRKQPLCEIELELKHGNPRILFDCALALLDDIPLLPEHRSKAERGYALYLRTPARPVKAGPVVLESTAGAGQAFQTIAFACLTQMRANYDGVLHSLDPEFVHQMRVALRRLRATFAIFKPVIQSKAMPAMRRGLDALATSLNATRDWDVWMTETLPRLMSEHPATPGLALLRRRAQAHRARYRRETQQRLTSSAYAQLMLTLECWLTGLPQAGLKRAQHKLWRAPILPFAGAALAALDQKAHRRGENLAQLSIPQRHRLRIAVKKLRYGTAFFAPLFYIEGNTCDYLTQLGNMQTELGLLNDLAVAEILLAEIAAGRPTPALVRAVEFARDWLQAQHRAHHRSLVKRWEKFTQTTPFWQA